MNGFWTPLLGGLARFFGAWGNALVESAPRKLQPHLAFARAPLSLDVHSVKDLREQTNLYGHEIDVRLAPDLVLNHQFRVPEAAVGETKRVAALEAARIMPITVERLVTSYEVTRMPGEPGARVALVAARKTLIEGLLEEARKSRLTIRSISAPTVSGQIRFRIPELTRRRQLNALAVAVTTLSALIIAGTAPTYYLDKLNGQVASTDQSIHDARAKTLKIAGLQQQVKSLQNLANAVQDVQDQARIVELLATLTKGSPDDVVLDELNLNGNRLRLSGRANSPEDWVLALQKESAFKDVRLTSVLGQQDGDKRRFEIHMTVVWPAERRKA